MIDLAHHPWLYLLAWSLTHFLWQGLLIGLATWVLLRLARRGRPELRYRLAYAAMLLMLAAFAATFGILAARPGGADLTLTLDELSQGTLALGRTGWLPALRRVLEPALPLVFGVWCLGAGLMLGRMATGFRWLHGTCLRQAEPAAPAWQARLDRLAGTLGVAGRVRLLISERLDTPIVLGALRPVILVPVSALLGLDAAGLEAVLVHELAHIRRHDYLANLLQCFAEILFFYHPVFWWVNRQIRLERELCCDDAAVRCCGDPLLYASALAGLEALRTPQSTFIHLAPAAKGGPLMLRIRRILTPETHLPSASSLLPLLSGLALVLALSTFGHRLQATPASERAAAAPQEVDFSQIEVAHQPPPPPYPADAKANRIQGTVVVRITLDIEGNPREVEAIEGPEELRPTAVAYASQWSFKPFLVKGKPTEVRFHLVMPFKLR